jgi:hypothetical protein
MLKKVTAGACAVALSLTCVGPAAAFDCFVAKKPATAGAAYEFGETGPVPLKKNPGDLEGKTHGAFVAFSEGGESGSTFSHAPEGVLPPARPGGSQHNCDGKGIDSFEACQGQ